MAEEMVASYSDKPITDAQKVKDLEAHSKTYAAFIQLSKWTVIGTVIILAALYLVFVH